MKNFPSLSLETKIHHPPPLTKFEKPSSNHHVTKPHTFLSSPLLSSPQLHQSPMVCTQQVSTPLSNKKQEQVSVVRSQSPTMELFPGISKPLHNFVLPGVNWGTQKHLRCMKVNDDDNDLNPNSCSKSPSPVSFFDSDPRNAKFSPNSPDLANRRAVLREKTLETEMSRDVGNEESGLAAAEEEEPRPWNLRTRRRACKAAVAMNNGGERTETGFGFGGATTDGGKVRREERPKFTLSLSRKEIEEDFMLMVGHKPARRPKKKPRAVQKQLDALFPGMWLREVTADAYKVPETNDNAKR